MKINKRHILIAFAAVLTLFASCNRNEAEVIPRKKLAKIYAEMLVMDQWIMETPGVRRIADTSLVYEPILEKYGYDSEDYRKSVDKYMDDPERFARIFRSTGEILDRKIAELEKEQQRLLALAGLPVVKIEYTLEELAPYMSEEACPQYYDSLGIVIDSLTRMYRLVSIETRDTLYEGPRMIVRDTLEVADSLALKDSLKTDKPVIMENNVGLRGHGSSRVVRKPNFHGSIRPVMKDSAGKFKIKE